MTDKEQSFLIRFFIIFALSFFLHQVANAQTTTVMVIDTGYDFKADWKNAEKYGLVKPVTCTDGHVDYTTSAIYVENNKPKINELYLKDTHGHGTHIAGLIAKYAGKSNYCLIIVKYYLEYGSPNQLNTLKALRYAVEKKPNIINYSGGGLDRSEEECKLVKILLDNGTQVIVAAGNERSDLEQRPFYPALCDDRVVVATNLTTDTRTIASSSNYSGTLKYDTWAEYGMNRLSLGLDNTYARMEGTSQATAILTGKMIKQLEVIKSRKDN